jgi:monofunctional glycosyltransferase
MWPKDKRNETAHLAGIFIFCWRYGTEPPSLYDKIRQVVLPSKKAKKTRKAEQKSQALVTRQPTQVAAPTMTLVVWRWAKRLFLAFLLLLLFLALYDVYRVFRLRSADPSISSFREIREANGIATKGFVFVPLAQISPNLIRAAISGEDQRFWEHNGLDISALQKNLTEGEVIRGGSTITQQLAKNLFLHEGKSYTRKLHEAYLALLLEATLPKERIIELYLNMIEWGDGIYGAEAAAQLYFHHSAKMLSKDEAAHLAAMIPNPRTVYNPKQNPARHAKHKRFILKWMPSMSATSPKAKP